MTEASRREDANQYEGVSDHQLVNHVTSTAGASGAGAMAELYRRHMTAMADFSTAMHESSSEMAKQTRTIRWLTWSVVVLTLLLLGLNVALATGGSIS